MQYGVIGFRTPDRTYRIAGPIDLRCPDADLLTGQWLKLAVDRPLGREQQHKAATGAPA